MEGNSTSCSLFSSSDWFSNESLHGGLKQNTQEVYMLVLDKYVFLSDLHNSHKHKDSFGFVLQIRSWNLWMVKGPQAA